MPTPIIPSVGRKVWYYSHAQQAEPIDATVIKVHDAAAVATPTSPVNLLVIDPDTGATVFRPYIVFHDDSEGFEGERYTWMPYQTKVAAAETPAPATSGVTE